MITQLYTIEELRSMFVEVFLNKTNKVTKVSDGSANSAIAFGNAKLAQKNLKAVAILEGHLFPETAFGDYLDNIAKTNGLGQRFGDRQSYTYIRIVAAANTIYDPSINLFSSTNGVQFQLTDVFTVGVFGYGYAKVRSLTTGADSNVAALTINTVANPPAGHQYCINEYQAQYGADYEEDDMFSRRLREGPDILSKDTISQYEQAFMKINQNILKAYFVGRDANGRSIISLLSVNGIAFTDDELNDIIVRAEKYLSLNDMRTVDGSGTINLVLQNAAFQPIDISMRVQLENSYDPNDIRVNIQTRLAKYLDYRFWRMGDRIQWSILLEIVQNTEGVRYVDDTLFYPSTDIITDSKKLPIIRGFQMLDTNGNIIQDFQGNLNPIFYPNQIDFIYQASVLQQL